MKKVVGALLLGAVTKVLQIQPPDRRGKLRKKAME